MNLIKRINKGSLSVIVMDNNALILSSFRQYIGQLYKRAYQVNCQNGQELLNLLNAHDFDLLIIDSVLEKENSLELIRKIKKLAPEITVIGLYTHKNDPYLDLLKNAGADGCLHKFELSKRSLRKLLVELKL